MLGIVPVQNLGGYSVEMRLDILLLSLQAFACETLVAARAQLGNGTVVAYIWLVSEALLGRF